MAERPQIHNADARTDRTRGPEKGPRVFNSKTPELLHVNTGQTPEHGDRQYGPVFEKGGKKWRKYWTWIVDARHPNGHWDFFWHGGYEEVQEEGNAA